MVTLLREEGYRVFIYSHDHPHPPHVHIEKAESVSVWNIETLECMGNIGCSSGELRKMRRFLLKYEQTILEHWHAEWQRRQQGESG